MENKRATLVGARVKLVVAAVACATLGCPVGPAEPVVTGMQGSGASGIDPFNGEQAEVALESGNAFLLQTLVATTNDFSLDNDFIYSPSPNDPQTRQVRRGVSIMGWSYSLDVGQTWTYQGKVHPPTGWSAIWGDPTVAVDPSSRNVVYLVEMGVSDAAWNAVTGGVNITSLSPGRDMVDGFCIARSTNGGIDFPEVACRQLGGGPASVDRTAVTVDGAGRVYVALNRLSGGVQTGTAVFRSDIANWTQFAPLPDPDLQSLSEPHLTTDTDGDVWFGSRDNRGAIGGDVSIMRFRQNAVSWDHLLHAASTCFVSLGVRDPDYAGSRVLRNAHTYSFAVGLEEQRPASGGGEPPPRRKVIRIAFQLQRNDGRTFLLFRQYFVGIGTCQVGFNNGAGWSTAGDEGQQFQPTLHYRELGGAPGWYATYLTTEGVTDPSDAYVRTKGVGVNAIQFLVPIMGQTFQGVLGRPTDLTPANWYACPRREFGSPDYWGDYIGLTQAFDGFRWWTIAAFPDSTPAPSCQVQTPFLGKPTHVASQRW